MTISSWILSIVTLISSFLPIRGYTEGSVDQPKSFLPGQAVSQNERTVSKLLFKGLYKYDIYGSLVPDLAESYEISEDGLAYTVKLKDDNYWTNGKKIDSDDLIYTAFNHPDLTGVATDRVDALTVRYTLPNKYSPFLSLLTTGVLPANSIEKKNDLKPVSSGDFRVARITREGNNIQKIVLLTNKDEYKIKKITFRYYSNEDELVSAAKLGEIQGFLAEKAHEITNYEDRKFPLQGIYYALYFNLRDETVKDLDLRKKLEKVIPIDNLIFDRGISVQGPISRSSYTDTDIKFDKFDGQFKENLNGKKITVTIPDTEKHIEFIKRITDLWTTKLDIDVEVVKVNPAVIYSKIIEPRNFQVLLYGQEIGRDPDRYVNWHSTQKDPPWLNLTGFDNLRADQALEQGRNESDPEQRKIHYHELQKTVVENVPVIFLYHPYTNYYISKYIQGIGEKYTFGYSDRFLDFYNWKYIETN